MRVMKATLLRTSGCDLDVVNAARVSFGKRKEVFDEKDARLLKYLAKHRHEIPFAHVGASFHFKAPIFVARQLAKHQVGFVWSEISRRYSKGPPEFWWPEKWRKAAADVKQGSSDEGVPEMETASLKRYVTQALAHTDDAYKRMLAAGVCAEQARAWLPTGTYTEWHWTGSLLGWARVWGLRTKEGAQQETQELVRQIDGPLSEAFPYAWAALKHSVSRVEAE